MNINNPEDTITEDKEKDSIVANKSRQFTSRLINLALAVTISATTGCSTTNRPTEVNQHIKPQYPTFTPTPKLATPVIPEVLHPKTATPLPSPIPIPTNTPTSTSTTTPTSTLSPTSTVQATVQITPTETVTLTSTPDIRTVVPQQIYDYIIHNIFPSPNGAITQIRGLVMINHDPKQPVNGVFIRVREATGHTYCTISNPSGSKGPGGFDVLLDDHAKGGKWAVSIVSWDPSTSNYTTDECNDARPLSEEVTVETNQKTGVVFVEWTKME